MDSHSKLINFNLQKCDVLNIDWYIFILLQ